MEKGNKQINVWIGTTKNRMEKIIKAAKEVIRLEKDYKNNVDEMYEITDDICLHANLIMESMEPDISKELSESSNPLGGLPDEQQAGNFE